ncbi:SGNH/GDSL hydrolase family protein [Chryseobacterium sp. MHB01]|uniref:SGNH/GDSL hydrolase family protein n=1 Tax=Chryseobacterium sp. MHB01 TaxID=3109433 RepID=UPI002AFDF957|nr:SGNH/GDSL hydrolase family protein [Chryseobacterium sp. MHB01]MEA1849199.1 SGNH/GDSL hydrolase family protein [Chryseobacterium sp. MHB01]
MPDQVIINISDNIPAPNAATIDKDGLVGNAVSKDQFQSDLDTFKGEVQGMIESDFKGVLMPTDTAPTADGTYKPGLSSDDANPTTPADYGTLYANAGNLRAKKGYSTLFYKKGSVWTKSEDLLPNTINSSALNPLSTSTTPADKSVADYVAEKNWKQDTVFNSSLQDNGVKQATASGTISNGSLGSVYGVSASIGIVPNAFNKVTISFAQNTTSPVTEIEIRLFQGKSAGGTLVAKKRQTVAPGAVTQAVVTVNFDSTINYAGEMWAQILVNNPFAYKRVSPATARTAANGYGTPAVTTVNNLDGTTFSTAQGYVDLFLEFNTLANVLGITQAGRKVVQNGKIYIPLKWNCVGHSIWAQDGIAYSGTTDIAVGIQTLVKQTFEFTGYNKYCYSGRSLGATSLTGDTSSITNYFVDWTDTSDAFWTVDTITNDFKRNIPIGTITDYNNATGVMTYYGALRALKDKIVALTPTANVFVANAMKRNNAGYTSTSTNTLGHTLLDYEKALMAVAKINKWRFVDQNRFSGIIDETLDMTTLDGLHPNDFGYSIIVRLWNSIFQTFARIVNS